MPPAESVENLGHRTESSVPAPITSRRKRPRGATHQRRMVMICTTAMMAVEMPPTTVSVSR